MRSVDLVSREWCDLVFEGRNRSYGAYRLRQEAGRRYARALWGTAVMIFLVVGTMCVLNTYVSMRSDQELAQLLAELRRMESLQQQDAHLLRFVDTRPKQDVPAHKVLVTVPEIVEQPLAQVVQEMPLPALQPVDTLTQVAVPDDSLMVDEPEELPLPWPPLTPTEVVQEMPEFPGGITALMRWLDRNIVYPPLVVHQNIAGTTYLTFLVDKEGSVTEPKVEVPLHPMISAAIMTAARKMPKWEPGKMNGQISVVRVTIPIEYHNDGKQGDK